MSEIIGKQIEVGLAVEGVRGTNETVASKWVKNVSTDIMARAEKVVDDNSQGVLEDSSNSRVVKKWFDGDLSGILHADVIGYLLYQIYGAVNSVTVTGAVTDHTFSLLQDIEHPTLSLFAKDGGVYQGVYDNGVVNTLEITATVDDYVRFSANILAKEANSNSDTPSYDTEYDFIGKDITVKVASSEAGLSGATALKLKELNVTFDTGAIADHTFGSYSPDDIYNAKLAIEGSFSKNYVDDTFKDLFTADTAVYMQIVIAGDQVLAGSNRPTITITLNKVQIQGWERSGANDELVTEEVEFKAFYNNTDSEQSTVIVRNVTAEYEIES
jgi:hypothetical protein